MNTVTLLEMRWCLDDRWYAVRDLVGREAEIVDVYAAEEGLRCCSFNMGLFIDMDGDPWSDDGAVDEPWMTMTWLAALAALAGGDVSAREWPWEESALVCRRKGDVLTMEDVHHSGRVSMRRVEIPFAAFCRDVAREAAVLADVVRAVRREARRRAAQPGLDADVRARLQVIDDQLPPEGEHGLGLVDVLGARCAAMG